MKKLILLLLPLLLIMGCEDDTNIFDDEDARDSFIGTWNCTETPTKQSNYLVTIEYDLTNSSQVLLKNFALLGNNNAPYAIIAGTTITIPSQSCCDNQWTIQGSGKLTSSKKIEWTYNLDDGADITYYTAIYEKQ
ncbi:MAG: hypothetical protein U9R32_11805 [Bacteroidota bacterium]|nr:hypothetical protein [Bacteroidota bacterium]